MTLSVVYVPETGHVVGALAVTGVQAPDKVSDLVGPFIPMRVAVEDGEVVELRLLPAKLGGLAADDEPRVFADPLAFGVTQVVGTDQSVTPKPTLEGLQPLTDPLTLDGNGLTVTVPAADDSKDTPVLLLISDGAQTTTVPWRITKGDASTTIPVTVEDGAHGVLVLVAGWAGALQAVTKQ